MVTPTLLAGGTLGDATDAWLKWAVQQAQGGPPGGGGGLGTGEGGPDAWTPRDQILDDPFEERLSSPARSDRASLDSADESSLGSAPVVRGAQMAMRGRPFVSAANDTNA
eukprot:810245-Prorocentrum_minimum.AAC.1